MAVELENAIGYIFKDKAIFELALTHRSYGKPNNERLEFLGDAILSAFIANRLYSSKSDFSEGILSQARAQLVNKTSLAELAKAFGLKQHLKLGACELTSPIGKQEAILADSMEAIIAAIYLDSDWDGLNKILSIWFSDKIKKIENNGVSQHPKTLLQEWTQANTLKLPTYSVLKKQGPQHNCIFTVECSIAGIPETAKGKGATKQLAEENAARNLITLLEKNNSD